MLVHSDQHTMSMAMCVSYHSKTKSTLMKCKTLPRDSRSWAPPPGRWYGGRPLLKPAGASRVQWSAGSPEPGLELLPRSPDCSPVLRWWYLSPGGNKMQTDGERTTQHLSKIKTHKHWGVEMSAFHTLNQTNPQSLTSARKYTKAQAHIWPKPMSVFYVMRLYTES